MSKSPIKMFKSGPVTASVWKNDGKYGPFFNVTLDRRYQDNGDTKYTGSLSEDSLIHAIKALGMAESFIDDRKQGNAKRTRRTRPVNRAKEAEVTHEQPSPSEDIPENDAVQQEKSADSEVGDSDELDSYL